MRRVLLIPLLVVAIAGVAGCIKTRFLIDVKPDGSGYIVMTQCVGSDAAMRLNNASEGPTGATKEQLEKMSEQLGDGVTLAKSEPIPSPSQPGHITVFAFKDLNQVRIPVFALAAGTDHLDEDDMPAQFRQNIEFKFAHSGGVSRIGASLPESLVGMSSKPASTNAADEAGDGDADNGRDVESTVKEMAGFQFDVLLRVRGHVVRQNATWPVNGKSNTWTLLHMDAERVATNAAARRMLREEPDSSDEGMGMLMNLLLLSGAEVETNRNLSIEFTPAP